jgi:hypothetical protein
MTAQSVDERRPPIRKKRRESEPDDVMEYIGHFSAAIVEKDLAHVKKIMRAHGVNCSKSNGDPTDNWWLFLLPDGATKVKQDYQGKIPHYTVRLPDGYRFTLEMGPINKDGYFDSPPQIFLDPPEDVET